MKVKRKGEQSIAFQFSRVLFFIKAAMTEAAKEEAKKAAKEEAKSTPKGEGEEEMKDEGDEGDEEEMGEDDPMAPEDGAEDVD